MITLSPQARNRVFLLFVIACFLTPLVAASLLVGVWDSVGGASHGQLLDPVRPVPPLGGTTLSGDPLDRDFLKERWTLIYGDSGACGEDCRTGLYYTRQVRLALGRELPRVQRLYLLTDPPDPQQRRWLKGEHPDLTAARVDGGALGFFHRSFAATGPGIYLVDPLGNLVLRYTLDHDPRDILKDLKRLLKLSHIG
ncbi:MAG: cytochrome oxidase assembly protein [Candidatus Competibacteraceae bacterium]|nr:cytochrome oxidase assembly protein [Candidatus Competibacteraceae bacterium]